MYGTSLVLKKKRKLLPIPLVSLNTQFNQSVKAYKISHTSRKQFCFWSWVFTHLYSWLFPFGNQLLGRILSNKAVFQGCISLHNTVRPQQFAPNRPFLQCIMVKGLKSSRSSRHLTSIVHVCSWLTKQQGCILCLWHKMVFFSEAGQPYEGPTRIQTCGLYYRGLACQAKITGELGGGMFVWHTGILS